MADTTLSKSSNILCALGCAVLVIKCVNCPHFIRLSHHICSGPATVSASGSLQDDSQKRRPQYCRRRVSKLWSCFHGTYKYQSSYSDIDISFFLVTVDLWSEDGNQEMNLVLHPSSQERIINTYLAQPKTRRRGTSTAAGSSSKHQQSPGSSHSTPTTSQYTIRPSDPQVCFQLKFIYFDAF